MRFTPKPIGPLESISSGASFKTKPTMSFRIRDIEKSFFGAEPMEERLLRQPPGTRESAITDERTKYLDEKQEVTISGR